MLFKYKSKRTLYAVLIWVFKKLSGPGVQINSYFQQEFPSLQAAGDQEKGNKDKDAPEEPYGPGPSLRPQSRCA